MIKQEEEKDKQVEEVVEDNRQQTVEGDGDSDYAPEGGDETTTWFQGFEEELGVKVSAKMAIKL